MIKKYLMIILGIFLIIMLTSTSSASFLFSNKEIYRNFQAPSRFKIILEELSKVTIFKNNNDALVVSNDNDDYEDCDEGDEDYDDDIEPDDPEEDVLLPKIWNLEGEKTPDDGDEEVVEEEALEENPTIDLNGEEGRTLNEVETVIENGVEEVINEIIVEEDGEEGETIDRVIEIVKDNNQKIGDMLQKVIEHSYAPGTTAGGTSENIVRNSIITNND